MSGENSATEQLTRATRAGKTSTAGSANKTISTTADAATNKVVIQTFMCDPLCGI